MAIAGLLLGGCRLQASTQLSRASLSFVYVGESGEDGTMNQLLHIENRSRTSAAPVLSLTALDKSHRPLFQVKVSTVYGSDRGDFVAPSGMSFDILRFSGPGEHDVADVSVTVESVAAARIPAGTQDVTAQALDHQGREITRFERFSAVRLTNEDEIPVSARIVYILWDQPADGDTQQAVEVTPVGGLTTVPAHGTVVVSLTGDAVAAAAVARNSYVSAVSLKAYNSQ
ncbi:MAG TPA: hypothetical protein VM677_32635 [Actinokineospora sp.]|jgi:hypothetical protein|nr:hypothetical protein [Actinokineospora sp.]